MVVLILFLVLFAISLFIIGRVIYRKRQLDDIYLQLKQQLDDRNEQLIPLYTDQAILTLLEPDLNLIKQLLQQALKDEPDMVEMIAIENRINQLLNDGILEALSQHEKTQTLYNIIVQLNLELNEARETFNIAATYHNYSVEYFPTKVLAKWLAYKTVAFIDQTVESKELIV